MPPGLFADMKLSEKANAFLSLLSRQIEKWNIDS